MYKTMKQIILIAIGLISLLPVSAQVLSKEESAKLGNTLETSHARDKGNTVRK